MWHPVCNRWYHHQKKYYTMKTFWLLQLETHQPIRHYGAENWISLIWSISGCRPWYYIIVSDVCYHCSILYVYTYFHDQKIDCQMDNGCFHILLFSLYCRTILSWILHFGARCYCLRFRCSTYVECKVHLFVSGWKYLCSIDKPACWTHHCEIFRNIFLDLPMLVYLGEPDKLCW